jgi:hypothetical protein
MPSRRVTRPKGEPISQKSGRRSTFLTQSRRHPLFFDEKYPLTGKNTPPILRCAKSNILSIILSMRGGSLMRFRTDHPAMAALNPLLHMENQARQKLKKFFHSA